MEFLKSALPALIALLGVTLTAMLGYRQWRKAQLTAGAAPFRADQQTAYKKLWELIEQVHIALRTEKLSEANFNSKLKRLNLFVLSNSLHIDESDAALARDYLEVVRRVSRLMESTADKRTKREWEHTAPTPIEVVQGAQALGVAVGQAQEIRDSLIARFQLILGKPAN